MTVHWHLLLLLLLAAIDLTAAQNSQNLVAHEKPKNVLFIILDDFRPAIRAAGDTTAHTPNLDKLVKSSFYFENCFAQVRGNEIKINKNKSKTHFFQQSLCAPSRNSLLTSRRPDTLHLYDFYNYWRQFSGNYTTLPQHLKDSGLHTHSIGKIFHPGMSSNFNDDYPLSWSQPPYHPAAEKYLNRATCRDRRHSRRKVKNLNCPVRLKNQPGRTLADIQTTEEAIRFLKTQRTDPFFLAVGFHKPHIPFQFPKKYLRHHPIHKFKYYPPAMSHKPYGMPNVAWNPYTDLRKRNDVRRLNVTAPFGPIPEWFGAKIRQHYAASVTYVDDLIGRLISYVSLKDTAIVLTSDHGWSLGEHALWAKYSNFEVGLKVPLLIKLPGQRRGVVKSNIVELVDLFPTVVDLLGLEQVKSCNGVSYTLCTEGKSLTPLLSSSTARTLISSYGSSSSTGQGSYNPFARMEMAFSQYPRPGLYPTMQPNSDRPKLAQIQIMGYSVRLQRFRYTMWVPFNASDFIPDWRVLHAEELYDHWIDPNEKMNLSSRREFNHLIDFLRQIVVDKNR